MVTVTHGIDRQRTQHDLVRFQLQPVQHMILLFAVFFSQALDLDMYSGRLGRETCMFHYHTRNSIRECASFTLHSIINHWC